jgi:hypothetical protein
MILEKGCAERGCACYDVRVDEGVEIKTMRELTDEEIENIYKEIFGFKPLDEYATEFARAILKKASERA